MSCVDIIDIYYCNLAQNYQKYVGQSIDVVIEELSKHHVVKEYRLKNLKNNDIVIWKSKKDHMAHVTVYSKNTFFYISKKEVKSHPVLLQYKNMLMPKFIVRLGGL